MYYKPRQESPRAREHVYMLICTLCIFLLSKVRFLVFNPYYLYKVKIKSNI